MAGRVDAFSLSQSYHSCFLNSFGVTSLCCRALSLAMRMTTAGKGGKSETINKFLGDISYPIYITHYPLIYMQMSWAESHKDAPLGMHVFVAVCIFFLAIGLAYTALKLYDLPVREWLKNRLFTKSTAK